MKIPSLLVGALLVSASATVNAESTCSEESGVCVCMGSCPSFTFTSGWDTSKIGGSCIANKSGDVYVGGNIPMSAGDVVTVDGIENTYPFDTCPGDSNDKEGGGDAVTPASPGAITVVGSWCVGGVAIIAATVVGW